MTKTPDRFTDWQMDEAIRHMELVIDGAKNANQASEDALQIAFLALKCPDLPHTHCTGTMIGNHHDECAWCGRDFRDPVHAN